MVNIRYQKKWHKRLVDFWLLFKQGSVVKGSRPNTYLKCNMKIWGKCAGRPAGSDVRAAGPRCPWGFNGLGTCRPRRLPRGGPASFFFTLWPCKVTRLFEGQGQLDSNEIKVVGSRCSREPKGKVHGRELRRERNLSPFVQRWLRAASGS